jgi:hypothetical protein
LNDAGVIALVFSAGGETLREHTRERAGRENFVALEFDTALDVEITMERIRLSIQERSSLSK